MRENRPVVIIDNPNKPWSPCSCCDKCRQEIAQLKKEVGALKTERFDLEEMLIERQNEILKLERTIEDYQEKESEVK